MYFVHLISSNNRKSYVHFEMCAHFDNQVLVVHYVKRILGMKDPDSLGSIQDVLIFFALAERQPLWIAPLGHCSIWTESFFVLFFFWKDERKEIYYKI